VKYLRLLRYAFSPAYRRRVNSIVMWMTGVNR
jgi:hypothetical protein